MAINYCIKYNKVQHITPTEYNTVKSGQHVHEVGLFVEFEYLWHFFVTSPGQNATHYTLIYFFIYKYLQFYWQGLDSVQAQTIY